MARQISVPTARGTVKVAFTDRSDGDFAVDGPAEQLARLRAGIIDQPWTWLRQVHGGRVVHVTRPGEFAGAEADAAVTTAALAPVAVNTADCAPVVLVAERGVAVVHAGWRGLTAGIIEAAGSQLRALAGDPEVALVGPCIGPEAYEFGPVDLDAVAEVFGDEVRSRTSQGTPSLDVPAAVAAACRRAGWPAPTGSPACTSDEQWFSHRTRVDTGRQTTVAWFEPDDRSIGDPPGRGDR